MDQWWASVTAGVVSGLVGGAALGAMAAGVRRAIESRADRRTRRMKVVSLMDRARALAFRAIRDGVYEQQHQYRVQGVMPDFAAYRRAYEDITVEALDLFVEGEEDVAFWTEIEFYAGMADPFVYLDSLPPLPQPQITTPRLPTEMQGVWVGSNGETGIIGYLLPRPEELLDWAQYNERGPYYGDLVDRLDGDKLRHRVVRPNSELPDLIQAPILLRRYRPDLSRQRDRPRWWLRGVR